MLPDLNHPVSELRLLLAPVKQVHVPAAVASAALFSPHRRPAAACRCHIGGEEKKTAAPAPNAAALRGPRHGLRAAPSAPVPGAARGLNPSALQPHPPRRLQNSGKREDHPGTDSNKLLPVHTSLPRPPLAGWRVRSSWGRDPRPMPLTRASQHNPKPGPSPRPVAQKEEGPPAFERRRGESGSPRGQGRGFRAWARPFRPREVGGKRGCSVGTRAVARTSLLGPESLSRERRGEASE